MASVTRSLSPAMGMYGQAPMSPTFMQPTLSPTFAHSSYAQAPMSPARVPMSPTGQSDYPAELGRASWKVLHSIAEHHPVNPTPKQMEDTRQFMEYFALVYPCEKCRRGFQELLHQHPPDVSSQANVVAWMSFFHDQVNASMKKPAQADGYLAEKGLSPATSPRVNPQSGYPQSPSMQRALSPASQTRVVYDVQVPVMAVPSHYSQHVTRTVPAGYPMSPTQDQRAYYATSPTFHMA